jgi:uncharacterized protein (TIGR00369 family)
MEFDATLPWRDIYGEGFNAHIGPIHFAKASDTQWRFYLDLDARHTNFGGVCHGGVSMALADVGMGAAVFEAGGGAPCSTIQFEAQFIAAAKAGSRLHGASRIVRRTAELAFMEAKLWSDGRQTLNASGVWKYLSKKG